jgi:hypothetical protein
MEARAVADALGMLSRLLMTVSIVAVAVLRSWLAPHQLPASCNLGLVSKASAGANAMTRLTFVVIGECRVLCCLPLRPQMCVASLDTTTRALWIEKGAFHPQRPRQPSALWSCCRFNNEAKATLYTCICDKIGCAIGWAIEPERLTNRAIEFRVEPTIYNSCCVL